MLHIAKLPIEQITYHHYHGYIASIIPFESEKEFFLFKQGISIDQNSSTSNINMFTLNNKYIKAKYNDIK